MTNPTQSASPARRLASLLQGNQVQQAIHVAARLGIADLLTEGPRDSAELAAAARVHPEALYRLLRALAAFEIFAEEPGRRFRLTPMGALLRSGPQSVLPFALWAGGVSYQAFGELEYSVRTGEPAFEKLFAAEFFEYLGTHPGTGETFDDMMSRHTAAVAAAVAEYDLTGIRTLVDVGGGRGDVLAAILRRHPSLRGVLVDHPRVLERAHLALANAGVLDRCTITPGDVLRAVPPGDGYLLKSVVHGLGDEAACRLLTNCRTAMAPDGRLLLVELVMPADNTPSPAALMDLLMLVGCHGRERTVTEYTGLLEAAGFAVAQIAPAKHGYYIIEGRASRGAQQARPTVAIEVNGRTHRLVGDPARSLLQFIREDLDLTGSKPGCGEGACGACTVLVDGMASRSCLLPVGALDGRRITTIEGLADGARLHPLQQSFLDAQAVQCGYCTPGMIMSAVGLLEAEPHPSTAAIAAALQGNLCRCGSYPEILAAVGGATGRSDGTSDE